MNKICKNCDTRCRLGLCDGREGDFKYCFRRTGSVSGLEDTITPFSTLHELYEKCSWLDWINPESLVLSNEPYGKNYMVLLLGQYAEKIDGTIKNIPVGYVTVEKASEDMKEIRYIDEK